MADEYRWLDREAAERLLRGESPDDAVPPAAREQAERLSRTLDALSASLTDARATEPDPAAASASVAPTGELPGEAAALAAFRAARAEAARAEAAGTGAGLVRIVGPGRRGTARPSRRRRTARLGLAAALIAGTVGGVAVAAGTGVLPGPFGGARPEPATSVSAATSGPGDHPYPTPSPRAGESATADGSTNGTATGPAEPGSAHGTPPEVASACRKVRQGRTLNPALRHTLENRAGGPSRITAYCTDLLEEAEGGTRDPGDAAGDSEGNGKANGNGRTKGNGNAGGNNANSGGTGQGNNGQGNGNGQGNNGQGNGNGQGQGQEKKDPAQGGTGNNGNQGGQGQGQGHGHGYGRDHGATPAPAPGTDSSADPS
jgi:hypothetical protein